MVRERYREGQMVTWWLSRRMMGVYADASAAHPTQERQNSTCGERGSAHRGREFFWRFTRDGWEPIPLGGAQFFLNLGGHNVGREDGSAERYQSLSQVFRYGALWEGRGGSGGGGGVVRERGREGRLGVYGDAATRHPTLF